MEDFKKSHFQERR